MGRVKSQQRTDESYISSNNSKHLLKLNLRRVHQHHAYKSTPIYYRSNGHFRHFIDIWSVTSVISHQAMELAVYSPHTAGRHCFFFNLSLIFCDESHLHVVVSFTVQLVSVCRLNWWRGIRNESGRSGWSSSPHTIHLYIIERGIPGSLDVSLGQKLFSLIPMMRPLLQFQIA